MDESFLAKSFKSNKMINHATSGSEPTFIHLYQVRQAKSKEPRHIREVDMSGCSSLVPTSSPSEFFDERYSPESGLQQLVQDNGGNYPSPKHTGSQPQSRSPRNMPTVCHREGMKCFI